MKEFALIAALLVLSAACVKGPAGQPSPQTGELGELGVQEEAGTGLDTMPEYSEGEESTSLIGEEFDLGTLI